MSETAAAPDEGGVSAPPVESDQTPAQEEEPERKLMEEELLQDMIRDREVSIKMIRKKLEQQAEKMDKTKDSLAELWRRSDAERAEQQVEMEKLSHRYSKLMQNYREAKDGLDMKKQQQGGAQLHLYNEVMKSVAAPESRDSSYVMRMQAQLCKAMHSMGMVETQLAIATNQSESVQRYLKETMTVTFEEKSQVELKLMNELMLKDTTRKEVEAKHKDMMDKFTAERDALLQKIEFQSSAEFQEEEDDEEEKEELEEILKQGREEIDRMEAENKEELKRLEEIKAKAIDVNGVEFVEDLCNSIAEELEEERQERDREESSDTDSSGSY